MKKEDAFTIICPKCRSIGRIYNKKHGVKSTKDVKLDISCSFEEIGVECKKCGYAMGNID